MKTKFKVKSIYWTEGDGAEMVKYTYYTIIDLNEVDIRIYLPEKVIFIEAARPR